MKKNIGTGDRIVRIAIGVVLVLAAFFVDQIVFKIILAAVGIFSFYEALMGWCAFYTLIGRNTCPLQ